MNSISGPRPSATRKINTDVVRIMLELSELVKGHDVLDLSSPALMEKVAHRVREERFVERALLVNFLLMELPDLPEVRLGLERAFGGEHRRSAALAAGSDSGHTQ